MRIDPLPLPGGGLLGITHCPGRRGGDLAAALAAWARVGPRLRPVWAAGGRVVVHCAAGLGRSGTVAACLLMEGGIPPGNAILDVRAARPGAIETPGQEGFVKAGGFA